jgi:Spy/CpxP family protein refolding chaperone
MGKDRAVTAQCDDSGDRLRGVIALAAMLLASAVVLAGTSPARAAMYKWVDEKGVVHYTDKMPPEAVDKASVELSPQGIPVKKTEKALTPEQRRGIAEDGERQRQVAKQQEEIARRDRALMSSYTSEAEIDLARNRSLQTINSMISSTQAFSEQLNKRKVEIEAKKVDPKGKPVIATLDRELESIDAELARQADILAQKKRETTAIIAKYDADKQRWRELVSAKAVAEPAKSASAAGGSASPAVPAKK